MYRKGCTQHAVHNHLPHLFHGKHALLLEQSVKTYSDQLFINFAIFTFAFSVDNDTHPRNTPSTN